MPSNYHYNKHLKELARKLRNNPTRAESKIWYELLADKQFADLRFLRQRIIGNYIVDFFCKELRLIIEVDGKSHDFDDVLEDDVVREEKLKSLGYRMIRFSDWEVLNNLGSVAEILSARISRIKSEKDF